MSKTEERIARMRAEADKALERAKKKAAEATSLERRLKAQDAAEERKRETRRKILIGSMHQERAAKYPDHQERLKNDLAKYLKRDDDRALFGLEPLHGVPAESIKPTSSVNQAGHQAVGENLST